MNGTFDVVLDWGYYCSSNTKFLIEMEECKLSLHQWSALRNFAVTFAVLSGFNELEKALRIFGILGEIKQNIIWILRGWTSGWEVNCLRYISALCRWHSGQWWYRLLSSECCLSTDFHITAADKWFSENSHWLCLFQSFPRSSVLSRGT